METMGLVIPRIKPKLSLIDLIMSFIFSFKVLVSIEHKISFMQSLYIIT